VKILEQKLANTVVKQPTKGRGGIAMTRQQWHVGFGVVFILLVGFLAIGCPTKVTTGAFVEVSRLEGELRRGVSTKMDVQRVLGAPNGYGSAIFPDEPTPVELWYYEDLEATDIKIEGRLMHMNMRQQILIIFFKKGVFDGFLWTSNAEKTKARF
jgi:hypothetical protein